MRQGIIRQTLAVLLRAALVKLCDEPIPLAGTTPPYCAVCIRPVAEHVRSVR